MLELNHHHKDKSGMTFGLLTAIAPAGQDKWGQLKWLCICQCGTEKVVLTNNLKSKNSCGCQINKRKRTHGMSTTPEYAVWNAMQRRCLSPHNKSFKNYGERGITVDSRWNNFETFYADMGPRPGDDFTLERKDNNGIYCPENCCWVKRSVQSRNTRRTRWVTLNGKTKCLKDWASDMGINYGTVLSRINRNGWAPIKALTTPTKKGN